MIKIQLDHKALMGLIESDPNFEVEIRKGILQTVVDKTIKAKSANDVLEFVQEVIEKVSGQDSFFDIDRWSGKKTINSKAKKILDAACNRRVKHVLSKKLDEFIADQIGDSVEKTMKKKMPAIEKIIARKFNAKLTDYIEDQIKSRLELLQ